MRNNLMPKALEYIIITSAKEVVFMSVFVRFVCLSHCLCVSVIELVGGCSKSQGMTSYVAMSRS